MFNKIFDGTLKRHDSKISGRSAVIRLAGIVGIIANIIFAGIKLLVGFAANSISIISDAVNNLTDAASSVITLAGLKLSERPPDEKHPLGYGRLEYISGMIVSALVLVTGIEFLKTSIDRIIHPQDTNYITAQFIVLAIMIIGKWLLSLFTIQAGKKTDSESLIASGTDARMDVLASVVTVIGAVVSKLTGYHVDGYVGALLSLFIIYTGIGLIKDTISSIIGKRPDKDLADKIRKEVTKYDPIMGAYDLIIHNYGPSTRLGSLNLEIPDYVKVEDAYDAMDKAQQDIYYKYGIYFTFGLYSVNTYDKEIVKLREEVTRVILSLQGAISIHNFHYDKELKFFRFDVIVDFNTDFKEFRKLVSKTIEDKYPGASVQINIDLDYA